MPMKRDTNGGGTEADGTLSTTYCSHCYSHGAFTNPAMTVQEMQDRVRQKMSEMGFPGFLSGFFARKIPKLKRWNAL